MVANVVVDDGARSVAEGNSDNDTEDSDASGAARVWLVVGRNFDSSFFQAFPS